MMMMSSSSKRTRTTISSLIVAALFLLSTTSTTVIVSAKLADRSRIVQQRHASGISDQYRDGGRPIEGPGYRSYRQSDELEQQTKMKMKQKKSTTTAKPKSAPWKHYTQSQPQPQPQQESNNHKGDVPLIRSATKQNYNTETEDEEVLPVSSLDEDTAAEDFERELSSQLTGCW